MSSFLPPKYENVLYLKIFDLQRKLYQQYLISDVLPSETIVIEWKSVVTLRLETVEPKHRRREKVSDAENDTIEEPIIHQPQSSICFDDNGEPMEKLYIHIIFHFSKITNVSSISSLVTEQVIFSKDNLIIPVNKQLAEEVSQVEYREFVLDIKGHERVKIFKNKDTELLLKYVNQRIPDYQFKVPDILRERYPENNFGNYPTITKCNTGRMVKIPTNMEAYVFPVARE
ncbi:hypothetical protein DAPPUDRAFT_332467 [Daphnia pulex]|uniref:Uncharacterized protein n=1 Tax=Daphnia pulex TaxID=6669 RepID=E9HQ11_DAPPU|nr:hypothetical protein DAPPUDRAFT_332467 [Daphnia pulex]|eukprot:EFX66175.1 hypothetical protein DAPPUDRAFT_332467 [Daphnia pulex]